MCVNQHPLLSLDALNVHYRGQRDGRALASHVAHPNSVLELHMVPTPTRNEHRTRSTAIWGNIPATGNWDRLGSH